MTYWRRTIESVIEHASAQFKVVALQGPPLAGKRTVMARLCGPERRSVDLTGETAAAAAADPAGFLGKNPAPALLAGIDAAPELMGEIKWIVDQSERRAQYWLTSTERIARMRRVRDAMPGRLVAFRLLPLSLAEKEGRASRPCLPGNLTEPSESSSSARSAADAWRAVFEGGWPAVQGADRKTRTEVFAAVIDRLALSFSRGTGRAVKPEDLTWFLSALALRTGRPLDLPGIARASGLTQRMTSAWLDMAESTGVIEALPAYRPLPLSPEETSALIRRSAPPALHLTDTGLAAHLLGITSPEALARHPVAGRILRTFVVTEIVKSRACNGERTDFLFAGADGVDLVIEESGRVHPVAVCPDGDVEGAVRRLEAFGRARHPAAHAAVVTLTAPVRRLSERITLHGIDGI